MRSFTYSLDKSLVPEVLSKISLYWNALDGMLVAPRILYREEGVAKNTRLILQGPFRNPMNQFQGVYDLPYGAKARKPSFSPRNVLPDVAGILAGKQPSSIAFEDLTLYKDGHAFVIRILEHALSKGCE